MLVGTVSIEKSEHLSAMLTRRGVRHEVLNAKNHAREALIIAEAGAKGSVTIATNMAGRGTDIKLGGNTEFRARKRAGTTATPEQYEAAYKIEYEKWQRDYEEVKNLGGLYVIGTERHESRRIDNQLRGRSGRQGDPGRSKFFLSMDDDLMRLFGGENMKRMMTRIGMEPGEPINHPWLNKSIEKAQKKVEERNFEIRKHLLEYDDVLNEQRNFIYGQRDSILADANLKERIFTTAEESIDEFLEQYAKDLKKSPETAFTALQDTLKTVFGIQLEPDADKGGIHSGGKNNESFKPVIMEMLQKDIADKEALAGTENVNLFIRYQYVQGIDKKWLDHLEQLEALREAVYLRSYGSKNPLTEYKLEGFEIFYEMLDSIRQEIASKVFRVRIERGDGQPAHRQARRVTMNTQHRETAAFSAGRGGGQSPMSARSQPDNVTIVRTAPKVGRNDPCPCGSGKKYKQCCGR